MNKLYRYRITEEGIIKNSHLIVDYTEYGCDYLESPGTRYYSSNSGHDKIWKSTNWYAYDTTRELTIQQENNLRIEVLNIIIESYYSKIKSMNEEIIKMQSLRESLK